MEGNGVLCHLTSLPNPCLADAQRFVRWLSDHDYRSWQVLPLTPPDEHGSPYASPTAFAAWPALMEAESEAPMDDDAYWLEDWGLYAAIKEDHDGKPWFAWPTPLRDREPAALAEYRERAKLHVTQQQRFQSAWHQLQQTAVEHGVALIGDLPIFVSHDSADVWAHRHLFQLNEAGMPEVVAGVPPDYFSEGGQKWGTVLYRWEAHRREGWRWWRERMQRMLRLFDIVRIDHFRAVHSNWAIPTEDEDARHGWWQDGPEGELMEALIDASGAPGRLLAEDLGIIPEEVVALRRRYNLPGMAVLQFGFDGNPSNPHHPDNIQSDHVVYTGTHDNNTTYGWWVSLDEETKQRVYTLLQPDETPSAGLMRLARESNAAMAMFPLQDILGLGEEARMNTPGTFEGNWEWAFAWSDLPE
ncbi:MAG: 4-alpha-glucanotransferase [Candidatus Thermoplasmatota archaeon]|nr:4-alpha-glucanotransferase [Candidatus Thermoplasmatota archaeon]MEC8680761.1 4-alpha-glucanotransferase [Candidatus Thermoplasmatota archaeon]